MLACLLTGTVSLGQQVSDKPFKVCPEVVTAKDTPCKVLPPTAVIAHRIEKPNQDRERVKETIKLLRYVADQLEKDLEKPN